jgi:hypothetical protein
MDHVRSLARAFDFAFGLAFDFARHGNVQVFAAAGLQNPLVASQSTAAPSCVGHAGPPTVQACEHTSSPVNPWQNPDVQSCSLRHGS